MIKLIITKGDKSHWFTICFNTQAEADKWLEIERTRPYWKDNFSVETIVTEEPGRAELAALMEQELAMVAQTRVDVKELMAIENPTLEQLTDLTKKLALLVGT